MRFFVAQFLDSQRDSIGGLARHLRAKTTLCQPIQELLFFRVESEFGFLTLQYFLESFFSEKSGKALAVVVDVPTL